MMKRTSIAAGATAWVLSWTLGFATGCDSMPEDSQTNDAGLAAGPTRAGDHGDAELGSGPGEPQGDGGATFVGPVGDGSSNSQTSDGGAGRPLDANVSEPYADGSSGSDTGLRSDAGTGTDPADSSAAPIKAPTRGTGPGDWTAGDYPPDLKSSKYLTISGVSGQKGPREYKVHVPPGYDPNLPAPIVFCIHGFGQDALMFCVTGAAMDAKSDQAGFILVMPNGYNNSWNAGTCCGDASTEKLDDVALFRALLTEVGKHVNIDLNRVYATGLSNGGYMSYRLACEAADIFAAVAPGAGAVGINEHSEGAVANAMSDFTACKPSRPISVLDVHGTSDPIIPYSLQAPSLALMVANNGCTSTTKAAKDPTSGGDTTCVTYDACPSGIEVTACTIENGGHCWFGSPDCGTGGGELALLFVGNNSDTMKETDATWSFFAHVSR